MEFRAPAPATHFGLALLLSLAASVPGSGQVVPVRTVPLATGDQFLVHPSERLGMASVSVTLEDLLADPFRNPARAADLPESRLAASPAYYSVSEGGGSGRTLPVSLFLPSDRWSAALSVAVQEIRGSDRRTGPWPAVPARSFSSPIPGPSEELLDDRSAGNVYLTGSLARRLGDGWTLGAGIHRADLDAVDGVEHLYPGSRTLEQDAEVTDYRVGVLHRGRNGDVLEAVAVHRRFDATHRIGRLAWIPPAATTVPCYDPCGRWERREETEMDRTRTTGARVGWIHPLEESPWRVGAGLTANYKDHPRIPNYRIMNIPRDPGTTWAWRFALGVARAGPDGSIGVDAVLEPVRTETWAVAEERVEKSGGGTILPGERTVENDFAFQNVRLRLGASRIVGPAEIQLGLRVHSVSYELEQLDRVEERRRRQDESWMEWTPTWGGSVALGNLTVRYHGRLTTGTGRPGTARVGDRRAVPDAAAGVDFVPAPEGPLTLDDARVWTHQLALVVPLE